MKDRNENTLNSHTISGPACTLQVTHCSYISRIIHDKTKLNPDGYIQVLKFEHGLATQRGEVFQEAQFSMSFSKETMPKT